MDTNTSYALLVRTSPFPGREDEFAEWYDGIHLAEVLALPGFVSARRYAAPAGPDGRRRFLAIYTIATGDIEATLARFEQARPYMSTTPALDPASVELEFVTAVTGVVLPAATPPPTMED
ncbi:DUF4286 family protein [Actinoplanes utahensis]|uniref:DUF4286 family protein n=1 Tax=Actinoplanes utahensis TaxID=1869 RepID=UPI00126A4C2C|nr:DUF4286 family protein [Actinoplanes utahensis]